MNKALTPVAACLLVAGVSAMTSAAPAKNNRVSIRYVPPKNPDHEPVLGDLRERRTLERLREFLGPFRLPRTLEIRLEGCDGEADAFYDDDVITICYEYVDELFKNMPEKTTPGGVEPFDAVAGPFFDTSLHEFAHALFDMYDLPLLGREEDAADHVAAYIYLQLGPDEARRLIRGTAYAFLYEAEKAGPLSIPEFADDHGTPAQRAYNVLCIAYGADTKHFREFADHIPSERVEFCEEEYEQVQDAYEVLIGPHIDEALAKEVFNRSWLQDPPAQRP